MNHTTRAGLLAVHILAAPCLAQAQPAPSSAVHTKMLWGDTSRLGRPFSKDPSVVRFRGRYLLYYSMAPYGDKRPNDGWGIGIAESRDLYAWTKVGEFLAVEPSEGQGVAAPFALIVDGRVHLFYQSYGYGPKDAICHAVSVDGLHFDRDRTNPIFRPSGDWTVGRAIDAEVVRHDGRWLLYVATRDPQMKVQMPAGAVSDGGFERGAWRVSSEPFLPNGAPGSWNSSESGHPGVFVDEDGTPYLFYQGNDDQGRTWKLSFVRLGWRDGLPVILNR